MGGDSILLLVFYLFVGLSEPSSIKTIQKYSEPPSANESIQATVSSAPSGNDTLTQRQYPPPASCNCYYQDSCGCVCLKPITWEDFQTLPQHFRSCPGFTLALRGGKFHSFPADYFYKVGDVRDFALDISDIQFVSLLDPGGDTSSMNRVTFQVSAFLRFYQVSVSQQWHWGGFNDLTPTRPLAYCEIQVVRSTVPLLTADFGTICKGVVTVVNVNYCGTMALENRVFAPFFKLNEVNLSNNRIRVMLRSYFPHPANELETINLAYNDIRSLPSDMFYAMPSLRSVDLQGNPITSINEAAFPAVVRNVRIIGLEKFNSLKNEAKEEDPDKAII